MEALSLALLALGKYGTMKCISAQLIEPTGLSISIIRAQNRWHMLRCT